MDSQKQNKEKEWKNTQLASHLHAIGGLTDMDSMLKEQQVSSKRTNPKKSEVAAPP